MKTSMRPFFFALLVMLASALGVERVAAVTLTWLPSAGGSLESPGNWDTGTTPSPTDDLIVRFRSSSPPTPPFASQSRDTLDRFDPLQVLAQAKAIRLRSLTLDGPAVLLVDSELDVASLRVGPLAQVRIRGGRLRARSIRIDGLLAVEMGFVGLSSDQPPLGADESEAGADDGDDDADDDHADDQATTLALRIRPGGCMLTSGAGGGNVLSQSIVLVHGMLRQAQNVLLLDDSFVNVRSNGVWMIEGDGVQMGGREQRRPSSSSDRDNNSNNDDDNSTRRRARIRNRGQLVFNASNDVSGAPPTQLLGVPLDNRETGTLVITSPPLRRTLARVESEWSTTGTVRIERRGVLQFTSHLATVGSTARVELHDDARLHVKSGNLVVSGVIESLDGGGSSVTGGATTRNELLVQARVNLTRGSQLRVRQLTLDDGVLSLCGEGDEEGCAADAASVDRLRWQSGRIESASRFGVDNAETSTAWLDVRNMGELITSDGAKVLDSVGLRVFGSLALKPRTMLTLQNGARIEVQSDRNATLTLDPRVEIRVDDDACELRVLSGSEMIVDTGGSDDDDDASAKGSSDEGEVEESSIVSIHVPIVSEGVLTIRGTGEAVFSHASSFATLRLSGGDSGARFVSSRPNTTYLFSRPIEGAARGARMVVQDAEIIIDTAKSSTTTQDETGDVDTRCSSVDHLVLLGATTRVHSCLRVGTLGMGSATSSSRLTGAGSLNVTNDLQFASGVLDVASVSIQRRLTVSQSNFKHIGSSLFRLCGGSSGTLSGTSLRLSPSTTVWIESDAVLTVLAGSDVYVQSRGEREEGDESRVVNDDDEESGAIVRVDGTVLFRGSGDSGASWRAPIVLRRGARVVTRQDGTGDLLVQLRASIVVAGMNETIDVGAGTTIAVAFPPARRCTLGSIVGEGVVQMETGLVDVVGVTRVDSLELFDGEWRVFQPAHYRHLQVRSGSALVLHTNATIDDDFEWSGGAIVGSIVQGSCVRLAEDARGSIAVNDTARLSSAFLLVDGRLDVLGGTLEMADGASIVVSPRGTLRQLGSAHVNTIAAMPGTLSVIDNFGSYECAVESTACTLGVFLANHANVTVAAGAHLNVFGGISQDDAAARLVARADTVISSWHSAALVLGSGLVHVAGRIDASLHVGGTLRIADVDGDVGDDDDDDRSSPARVLDVQGDLVFGRFATLVVRCGGSSATTEPTGSCDQLAVNKSAVLGGRLLIAQRVGDGQGDGDGIGPNGAVIVSAAIVHGAFDALDSAGSHAVTFEVDRVGDAAASSADDGRGMNVRLRVVPAHVDPRLNTWMAAVRGDGLGLELPSAHAAAQHVSLGPMQVLQWQWMVAGGVPSLASVTPWALPFAWSSIDLSSLVDRLKMAKAIVQRDADEAARAKCSSLRNGTTFASSVPSNSSATSEHDDSDRGGAAAAPPLSLLLAVIVLGSALAIATIALCAIMCNRRQRASSSSSSSSGKPVSSSPLTAAPNDADLGSQRIAAGGSELVHESGSIESATLGDAPVGESVRLRMLLGERYVRTMSTAADSTGSIPATIVPTAPPLSSIQVDSTSIDVQETPPRPLVQR